ncbi:hypothetical protein ACHAQJ_002923 [Trichoderma viride]
MRIQKTFTIVPPPGPVTRTPVDSRPMTSKQVRKAYREANRVPRVSRAELLRQERAEQERIRKEFEKEKAAAKAKLLREKKKAKEQAEREEKKKKGLPLVTVRPSQDTIAKFFRGNGSGNKRDCKGEDVDEVDDAVKAPTLPAVEELEEEESDEDFPSPKRPCNENEQNGKGCENVERGGEETVSVPEEPCTELGVTASLEKNEPIAKDDFLDSSPEDAFTELDITTVDKNEPITEDYFSDGFEIMSDEEISKLPFNDMVANDNVSNTEECLALQSPTGPDAIPVEEHKGHLHDKTALHESNSDMSIKNPEAITLQEFDLLSDDEDDLELEMLALDVVMISQQQQLLKEPTEKLLLEGSERPTRKTGYEVDLGLAAGSSKEILHATSPRKHDQTALMPPPPPPVPTALRPSHSPISPVATKPQPPPLSTQQILFSMDDFFPTSSQQAAELEEEETTFISPSIKSSLAPKAPAPSPVPPKDVLSASTLSSSPEPPRPFFTSSGSNERIAVALLRSRRTAEQEEEQRQRVLRLEMVELQEAQKKEAERRAREERLTDGRQRAKTANHAASKIVSEKRQIPEQARQATAGFPQFSNRKRLVMNDNHTPVKPSLQRTPLAEGNPKAVLPDTKSPTVANMSRKLTSPGINIRPLSSSFTSLNTNKTLAPEAKHQHSSPKHAKTPTKVSNKENMTSSELNETKCPMASQESEFGGSWMDELATELSL